MTAAARARSARSVTALIRRLQAPAPTREYEQKQRLLAVARRDGWVAARAGVTALGLTSGSKTASRLLAELADEGLLERRGGGGRTHYVPAGAR